MKNTAGIEFTGERYVPTLGGQIKYEHLHRYALALDFVAGKSVLDIAFGEGYGAALMARVAARVVGVDISPASVEHARQSYYYENLEFLVGACESVPLPDASVDIVTSFETIEHHDRHEEMMSEIKRVLKPGGILVISSPNRLTYSDEPNYSNPYHVRELYYDEFHSLLGRYFKHINFFGQRLAAGSFVYRLQGADSCHLKSFTGDAEHLAAQACNLPAPIYFIAICSDTELANPNNVNSVYLDGKDDIWKRAEIERQELFRQAQEQHQNYEEEAQRQAAASAAKDAELSAVKIHLSSAEEMIARQTAELAAREAELAAVKVHLSSAEEMIARQADELSLTRARLSAYEERSDRQAIELSALRDQLSASRLLVGEYEVQTAQQAAELSEMYAHISSQRGHLNQLALLLTEARTQLSNKQALLSWMYLSRSWKVTTLLRQLSLRSRQIQRKLPQRGRKVFHGYVDTPVEGAKASGQIEVVGWAYSVAAPVARVEAFIDNMPLGAVRYGHARPDVVEAFPSLSTPDCGYAQRFTLDEMFAGRRTFMIRVTDERGNFQDYIRTVVIEPHASAMPSFTLPEVAPVPEDTDAEPGGGGGAASSALVESFFGDFLSTSKKLLSSIAETYLENFLISNSTIEVPYFDEPEVSIVLVLYNRAELTLQCLLSILKSNKTSFEVIIVDNASSDETGFLLKRIKGARIIENATNVHYLRACNQAARHVRGRYILLLNNDTQVLAGSIPSAVATLSSSNDIGAVGGKIILPDGTLQEAGSIIWSDGSCAGYGRGDSPSAPAYMFRRDVDYCSAAFLLTRRELFLESGGFDESFAPAYYEETDFCARLWEQGKRVVYDPNAIVLHYEFASSGSQAAAIELQVKNKKVFADKHRDWLSSKLAGAPANLLTARSAQPPAALRILFIDDRVPHVNLGSGFPRSNRILTELVRLRHFVTFYPLGFPKEDWADVYQDVPREVEVMLDHGVFRLEEFLGERSNYYDFIFVSRPHNMASLKAVLARNPHLCQQCKIIYDAEALFSLREIEQMRAAGKPLSPKQEQKLINEELRLASNCHRVVSVSERESSEFTRFGFERVHTLGHSIKISLTQTDFNERRDILFVGAIHAPDSPNADSLIWFSEEILPLIRRRAGADVQLIIAGPMIHEMKNRLAKQDVQVMGKVEDLTALYERARIFIAPTRFAAGIPHKVHEAAAYGLPVVATSLIGSQLGWGDGKELLLADDSAGFADACVRLYQDRALWSRLRERALERVRADCSPETFTQELKAIFE
jgi:GT2 family glycosyltransferase/SAM-dependent methyltransferase